MCGAAIAEEVTEDVFVQLWRHPEQFDPARGTLRTYLVTVAWGKAVNEVRTEGRRRRRERRGQDRAVRAGGDDIDVGLLERGPAALIADAVSSLPLVEREALAVALYGQCTYNQTAVILGQPEGTIKSRIRAGLRRLGSALGDVSIGRDAFVSIR